MEEVKEKSDKIEIITYISLILGFIFSFDALRESGEAIKLGALVLAVASFLIFVICLLYKNLKSRKK
jgi:hypothetical protein